MPNIKKSRKCKLKLQHSSTQLERLKQKDMMWNAAGKLPMTPQDICLLRFVPWHCRIHLHPLFIDKHVRYHHRQRGRSQGQGRVRMARPYADKPSLRSRVSKNQRYSLVQGCDMQGSKQGGGQLPGSVCHYLAGERFSF